MRRVKGVSAIADLTDILSGGEYCLEVNKPADSAFGNIG